METDKIIKNKACIELELCGKKETVDSNETETEIIKLEVKKEANCKYVIAGGCIEYTITICNDSDVNLCDLEFKDILAHNTEFKQGSFKVNGISKVATVFNNILSYKIAELKENGEIVITFEVKVD